MTVSPEAGVRTGLGITLRDTVSKVAEHASWAELRFGLPEHPEHDWWNCADLIDNPDQFTTWRKTLASWLTTTYGDAPDRVTAGYVMGWYLNVPGFLAGLLFHSVRRIPSLRPRDIAFRLSTDRPHPVGVAVLSSEFACLPDDAGACLPEATIVADERALAALLRARFAAHAAQFVAAFGPTVRLGRRTLWAAATDALDKGLWAAGKAYGNEDRGVSDANLLLPARLRPFTSGSTLYPDSDPNRSCEWTRRRESCCFHYVLAGGQPACKTCPRNKKPGIS